jgi:hypothetical protein
MKKLNQWFNSLPGERQKLVLIGFCMLFALTLIITINHNQVTIKPMYIPAHIGRTTDSLTHKK